MRVTPAQIDDGNTIPTTFSRHATVHGVTTRKLLRRNAVQAIMFIVGLLVFIDEEAAEVEAA